MPSKTKHSLMYDSSIAAGVTDVQTTPSIPVGKKVRLQSFGGFDPSIGDGIDSMIAIQWGAGTTWQTIRAGGKVFEFQIGRDFLGDGAKRFRLVRQNKSASAKIIVAWLEALVMDV